MSKTPEKILVIKLGAFGGFIQALGPMAAIRKHHKNAQITLLTTKFFEEWAKDCGYFDQIEIDVKPKFFHLKSWLTLRKSLNAGGYTRIYDLQNNDRTQLYFNMLKNPKPEWVGIAKGASHRNISEKRTAGHAFNGHVQTLALAGIKNIKTDPLTWMKASISAYPLKRPYVLLLPGCAPEHPEKRWPADKYGRLAKILAKSGFQPVIIGTNEERKATAEIATACPEALDLTAQTSIAQITTLARGAAGAIGNDTGPMHLIGATGCPCLTLFSKHSDPVKHAPKGINVRVLQTEDLNTLKSEKVLNRFKPREQPEKSSSTMH